MMTMKKMKMMMMRCKDEDEEETLIGSSSSPIWKRWSGRRRCRLWISKHNQEQI